MEQYTSSQNPGGGVLVVDALGTVGEGIAGGSRAGAEVEIEAEVQHQQLTTGGERTHIIIQESLTAFSGGRAGATSLRC